MPIFIDELVFRGEVVPASTGGASDRPSGSGGEGRMADRQEIIADVTEAVIEHLERALERIGDR